MLKRLLAQLAGGRGSERQRMALAELLAAVTLRLRSGDVAGALDSCQAARRRFGEDADVLAMEGGCLAILGRGDEARRCLMRALDEDPVHPQALNDLGNLAMLEGRYAEAAACYDRLRAAQPATAALLVSRGQAARALGDLTMAANCFREALALDPGNAAAGVPLCLLLLEDGQESLAEAIIKAESVATTTPGPWHHMAGLLKYKYRFAAADGDALLAKAEAEGMDGVAFWIDRGVCARSLGDFSRALSYLARALVVAPGHPLAVFVRGLTRLALGDWPNGWDDYEARLCDVTWQALPEINRWHGEPLPNGELLVVAEQGLGDEVLFASCFDDLPTDAAITVECDRKLLPIFEASFPRLRFLVRAGEPAALERIRQFDRYILAGSLPGLYRRSNAAFPCRPYLTPPPAARAQVRTVLAGLPAGARVGLSWRGGTRASLAVQRSLPLPAASGLLAISGIQWINLQYGDCASDLEALRRESGADLHHWPELLDRYELTAALVAELDLVVTVCTSVADLAGALGRPVWVLAPFVPEWRFGWQRRCMPWYPGVEVFCQQAENDWSAPLAEVMERLKSLGRVGGHEASGDRWQAESHAFRSAASNASV